MRWPHAQMANIKAGSASGMTLKLSADPMARYRQGRRWSRIMVETLVAIDHQLRNGKTRLAYAARSQPEGVRSNQHLEPRDQPERETRKTQLLSEGSRVSSHPECHLARKLAWKRGPTRQMAPRRFRRPRGGRRCQ